MIRLPQRESDPRYWDDRSADFVRVYTARRSLFDRLLRKGLLNGRDIVLSECRALRQPTVLDVGCGPGFVAEALLQNGGAKHVVGIDFSDGMLSAAQGLLEPFIKNDECELVAGDISEHEFEGRRFDLVAILGVLEYIRDPSSLLQKAASLADRVLVTEFTSEGIWRRLRVFKNRVPIYPQSEQSIRRLYRQSGLPKPAIHTVSGGYFVIARFPEKEGGE